MFRTVAELVDIAERENLTIAEIMINREMTIS
ncbi:L-serine ammonia-lyase, iron-sulfur-dependent, subunit alpha, partial [Listeria booriae]|nr:L-serine ammonia-lyase, iron-sulfur-dependent, subunit alpha [Listeria booriae]